MVTGHITITITDLHKLYVEYIWANLKTLNEIRKDYQLQTLLLDCRDVSLSG
jgi:hypothetical protein